MPRRFGKRGLEDKLSFTIWEIMVILMVIIALTLSVRALANNTTYWKKYHSADLALITDLILTNQGEFDINYNLKEMHPNLATKALRIEPLTFEIVLRDDAYFVYDKSSEDDRFPQSYIFGRDTKRTKVVPSNSTNEYIILHKQGKTLSMSESYTLPVESCPTDITKADTSQKHFEVTSISDSSTISKEYASQINSVLRRYAGTEQEMQIFLIEDSIKPTTIYYNTGQITESGKMSCLIRKAILKNNPDLNIIEIPYDDSLNANAILTNEITSPNKKYIYWVIIQVNSKDVTKDDLGKNIISAIDEYYN
jgi:hypothetical protein